MYKEYIKHVCMDVTEEIERFVQDEVFGCSEYLFVTKEKRRNRGYCTKCNQEYEVGNLHHNERGICPLCGANLTVKLTGYGRGNCRNEACFYYFEKSIINPNVIVCKGYYVNKYYNDYKNPKTEYCLEAIYVFKDKESVMIKNQYGRLKTKRTVFDFNQGWLAPKMCYCSFESIKKVIKSTNFKYIPYEYFAGHYSMVKLFAEYSKHPCIEYLVKEGLGYLVENKLRGYPTHRAINWNGKTIFKILKISKLDFREIKSKKVKVTFEFLKVFQDAKKQKWRLSTEEIISAAEEYWQNYEELKKITEYSSISKILKYLSKQYDKFNGTKQNRNYSSKGYVLSKLKDYIADCKLLGMDINKEQVLFPKNLYTAHQNTTKQIKIKENKKYDAQIKKRIPLLEKYIFQDEDYIIRPAKNSLELIEEGAALNHCVATHYTIPYAKGETNIFFVRKLSEHNKPYCTVEVKDNKVIQAYIKDDRVPDIKTLNFIEVFKKKKLECKNTKKYARANVPA